MVETLKIVENMYFVCFPGMKSSREVYSGVVGEAFGVVEEAFGVLVEVYMELVLVQSF